MVQVSQFLWIDAMNEVQEINTEYSSFRIQILLLKMQNKEYVKLQLA